MKLPLSLINHLKCKLMWRKRFVFFMYFLFLEKDYHFCLLFNLVGHNSSEHLCGSSVKYCCDGIFKRGTDVWRIVVGFYLSLDSRLFQVVFYQKADGWYPLSICLMIDEVRCFIKSSHLTYLFPNIIYF